MCRPAQLVMAPADQQSEQTRMGGFTGCRAAGSLINATAADLEALPWRAGHSAARGPSPAAGPLVTDLPCHETIYLSARW